MSDNISVEQAWEGIDLNISNGNYSDSESSGSISYIVSGASDDAEALNAAYGYAPENIVNPDNDTGQIPKNGASVSERLTENTWKISVSYGHDTGNDGDGSDDGPVTCNFSCSGESTTIVHAKRQVCLYNNKSFEWSDAREIPIGWNGRHGEESQAEGVNVYRPAIRESYTKSMSVSKVNNTTWKKKITSACCKVNSSSFKGYNAGEVLFLGVEYTAPKYGNERVDVTFNFEIRPNEKNPTVAGHTLSNVTIQGHEYAWVVMEDDNRTGVLTAKIKYIFGARVYSETDFGIFGL